MFGKHGVSGLAESQGSHPAPDAPDKITIARVSAELASRGSLGIQTLPAVPITGFIVKLTSKGLNQGSTHTGKVGTRMSHPDGGSRDE